MRTIQAADNQKVLIVDEGSDRPDTRLIVERKGGIVSVRPADDEPVQVMFTPAALTALDLQIEDAFAKVLGSYTAHAELDAEFWQKLQAFVRPPKIEVHNHPKDSDSKDLWARIESYPVGTTFVRTKDGLALDE